MTGFLSSITPAQLAVWALWSVMAAVAVLLTSGEPLHAVALGALGGCVLGLMLDRTRAMALAVLGIGAAFLVLR